MEQELWAQPKEEKRATHRFDPSPTCELEPEEER